MLPPLPATDDLLPAFAPWFDVAGLAVFAASGALAAAKRGQTAVTLAFFALGASTRVPMRYFDAMDLRTSWRWKA